MKVVATVAQASRAVAALMLLMGMNLGRSDKYLVIALLVHAAIGYVLYDENKAVKALLSR